MVALFVVFAILVLLTFDYLVLRLQLGAPALAEREGVGQVPAELRLPWADAMALPRGLFVDATHTWAQLEPAGTLRVGADAIPAALLGAPDEVELLPVGTKIGRGDVLATLRRADRTISLRSPVEGVVEGVNSEAVAYPTRVAREPFTHGWLYKLTPRKLGKALRGMRVAEEAVSWMSAEMRRLRDTLATLVQPTSPVGATLQDGGLPIEGLAAHLDDAAWAALLERFFERGEP